MGNIKKNRIFLKLLTSLYILFVQPVYASSALQKGPISLNNISMEVWGSYKIRPLIFPNEEWEFFVLIVPAEVKEGTLIKIAKEFYLKYPNTRARIFSDKKYVQQYVDRDMFYNDKTGKAKEVVFPNDEWVQNNHLGNINNRSEKYDRHWMLEHRYGSLISALP